MKKRLKQNAKCDIIYITAERYQECWDAPTKGAIKIPPAVGI